MEEKREDENRRSMIAAGEVIKQRGGRPGKEKEPEREHGRCSLFCAVPYEKETTSIASGVFDASACVTNWNYRAPVKMNFINCSASSKSS